MQGHAVQEEAEIEEPEHEERTREREEEEQGGAHLGQVTQQAAVDAGIVAADPNMQVDCGEKVAALPRPSVCASAARASWTRRRR